MPPTSDQGSVRYDLSVYEVLLVQTRTQTCQCWPDATCRYGYGLTMLSTYHTAAMCHFAILLQPLRLTTTCHAMSQSRIHYSIFTFACLKPCAYLYPYILPRYTLDTSSASCHLATSLQRRRRPAADSCTHRNDHHIAPYRVRLGCVCKSRAERLYWCCSSTCPHPVLDYIRPYLGALLLRCASRLSCEWVVRWSLRTPVYHTHIQPPVTLHSF